MGILSLLFPEFLTKSELEASKKALSDELSLIKKAVLDEQGYTDKNFHILAAKIDQVEASMRSISAQNSPPKGILSDFKVFARLAVQNYEDLTVEREKNANIEKRLSAISAQIESLAKELNATKLNLTQLNQPTEVNSTKLNSTKLNLKSGMTAMTSPRHGESANVGFAPVPEKEILPDGKHKMTQGHYSVMFVLYNLQADIASRAVSLKTVVKELYGAAGGHSKESFVSRIVRELDSFGLIVKGPRGRTSRMYLSKQGVVFCKAQVLARKEGRE